METKQILMTGGTGFIGSYLCEELLKAGHFLTLITRSADKYSEEQAKNMRYIGWEDSLQEEVNRADIIINLAGENLFGQRWTESVKKKIYDSRVLSTGKLTRLISTAESKPELFISASGVGIYGDRGDTILDESSSTADDFLATVCIDWEKEALKAAEAGVRVVISRLGLVMEDSGGFIEKMILPFKLFAGGPIGDGKQFMPWIHMADLLRAILFLIEQKDISGPVNLCSPEPVTMNELAESMGKILNRPSFIRVPEFALNLVLGEAAQPVLSSLRVHPKLLKDSGFEFEFNDLKEALADIL